MANIISFWVATHYKDVLFFAVCGIPAVAAATYFIVGWMRAWNKSIARRRLVFLLKFALWLIAMALKKLSEKMLELVYR